MKQRIRITVIIAYIEENIYCSKSEEAILNEGKGRGLAVICTHTTFTQNPVNLTDRPSGHTDKETMEEIWKLYDDCEVLTFVNKTSNFYNTELEMRSKSCILRF